MSETFTPPRPLNTAVLFLVFNRPDTTARVFEAIRQAKPPRLYVAADGPREGREGEAERVAKVREIATGVDWPCEVNTLFRDKNLGCKYAVGEAITWFFEHEEQGIVLEDDCLPSQSFFGFCEELLNRFRDNNDVFLVSGRNELDNFSPAESADYFFTYGSIWGWASWRRAWKFYDIELKDFEKWRVSPKALELKKCSNLKYKEIISGCEQTISGAVSSWAYQWALTRIYFGGLGVTPKINMIRNIGFGDTATHTKTAVQDRVQKNEINFPLKHNNEFEINYFYYSMVMAQFKDSFIRRVMNKIKMMI